MDWVSSPTINHTAISRGGCENVVVSQKHATYLRARGRRRVQHQSGTSHASSAVSDASSAARHAHRFPPHGFPQRSGRVPTQGCWGKMTRAAAAAVARVAAAAAVAARHRDLLRGECRVAGAGVSNQRDSPSCSSTRLGGGIAAQAAPRPSPSTCSAPRCAIPTRTASCRRRRGARFCWRCCCSGCA